MSGLAVASDSGVRTWSDLSTRMSMAKSKADMPMCSMGNALRRAVENRDPCRRKVASVALVIEAVFMRRQPKKDVSTGPVWDAALGRWLTETVLPDNSRRRRRLRRKRDAQVSWAAQLKSIQDG